MKEIVLQAAEEAERLLTESEAITGTGRKEAKKSDNLINQDETHRHSLRSDSSKTVLLSKRPRKCRSFDDMQSSSQEVTENNLSKSATFIGCASEKNSACRKIQKTRQSKCLYVDSSNGLLEDVSQNCVNNQKTREMPSCSCNSLGANQQPHEQESSEEGFEVVPVRLQIHNGQVIPISESGYHTNEVFHGVRQHRSIARSYETSQSSESVICRICHSAEGDKLIAPCKCAGSSRYVHAGCLVTWFKKSVKNQCELCKGEVKIRKINHNLALWRKPEDRPIPLIWFSVFFIGLFLNILSIYVNASEYCKSTACLIFYVVNGFGIILDAAFLWFWFLKCRHYWKKWCALNQDWYIDDLDEAGESEPLRVQFVRNEGDLV